MTKLNICIVLLLLFLHIFKSSAAEIEPDTSLSRQSPVPSLTIVDTHISSTTDRENIALASVHLEESTTTNTLSTMSSAICSFFRTLGTYISNLLIEDPNFPPAYMHEAYRDY